MQQGSGQSSSRETPLSSAGVLSSRRSNDALFSRGSSEAGLDVSGSDEATWRDVSEAEAELFEHELNDENARLASRGGALSKHREVSTPLLRSAGDVDGSNDL